jgi:hypothetical protein
MKPMRYRRRITEESRSSIRAYAAVSAEAIWAWNRLHSTLFDLFWQFLGREETNNKYEVSYAIWHTFQSDKSQREMIRSVAEATLPPTSLKLKQIKWLLKSVDRIAPFRNAMVHVPVTFRRGQAGRPSPIDLDIISGRKQLISRLEAAGSGRFWTTVAGDLFVLGQFASGIIYQDEQDFTEPSGRKIRFRAPHRPRLLSLRRINEIERLISAPQTKKVSKRQRRPQR